MDDASISRTEHRLAWMTVVTLAGYKQVRRDAREAEGAPLLREYRVKSLIEGSNPSLSAIQSLTSLPRHRIIRGSLQRSNAPVARLVEREALATVRWIVAPSVRRRHGCRLDVRTMDGSKYNSSNAPVAQLDRVPGYELGGREFESLRARQSTKKPGTETGAGFFVSVTTNSMVDMASPAGYSAEQPSN